MRQPRFIDPTTVTDQLVNESLGYTPQRDQNRTTDEVGRSAGQTDLTVSQGVKLRSRKIRHLQFSEGFNVDARAEIATVAIDPAVTDALQVAIDGKQPLDADLTTIAGLGDPGADRILFWDDSAGAYAFLEASTNLTITGTAMTATGGSGGTIIVQNDDVDVDTATGTVDFSDQFSVTSSPAGEANVSIADNYVLNTGDTITGDVLLQSTSATQLQAKNAGGTEYLRVDTTNNALVFLNAADLYMYSDNGSTVKWAIDGATGIITFGVPNTSVPSIRTGTGTPESAVSAQVGSIFLRSDGGTDTAVYRKESGTGNTGWVAVKTTYALGDLADVDVTSPGSINGKGVSWDTATSKFIDQWVYTGWIGPWRKNDIPGTATTALAKLYFNTATAVSQNTNPERAGRVAYIVGAKITSDAARTAGTATVKVLINGASTAFDAGSVVLDGTRTTQDATIVAPSAGIAVTSGGDTIGVEVVTSGWTPTTANIQVDLLVIYDPI